MKKLKGLPRCRDGKAKRKHDFKLDNNVFTLNFNSYSTISPSSKSIEGKGVSRCCCCWFHVVAVAVAAAAWWWSRSDWSHFLFFVVPIFLNVLWNFKGAYIFELNFSRFFTSRLATSCSHQNFLRAPFQLWFFITNHICKLPQFQEFYKKTI